MSAPPPVTIRTGAGAYLALTAALLGWMFDGAEMGLFALVGNPAVKDLLQTTDTGKVSLWFGVIIASFLVGAATGGVLFGWLGDRIGRVRAMTLSIFVYAFFTGLCGFASDALQLGVLRFIASLGMGGEWSLGVALVMEIWPDRSRAFMAGLIGAAANVGFLLVGFVGLGLNAILSSVQPALVSWGMPTATADMLVSNSGWRLMMILGALPALLTLFIRMFVPESERWQQEKARGATSHWATVDLLGVLVGAAGPGVIIYLWAVEHSLAVRVVGTLLGLVVATLGYLYPVFRYLGRMEASAVGHHAGEGAIGRMLLAAGLSGVSLLGTWGSVQWAPKWADELAAGVGNAKEYTQIWLAAGAIVGTLVAAKAGDWIGRRQTYRLMCLTSLGSTYLFYLTNTSYGNWFLVCAFLMGMFTATFYGWLPLYLPELFRTHVRATGQGFGFNYGRILAAVGALQTGALAAYFKTADLQIGPIEIPKGAPGACSVISLVYLLGLVLIQFAPETKGKPLPE